LFSVAAAATEQAASAEKKKGVEPFFLFDL